jgi:WD repeat-containing protein 35
LAYHLRRKLGDWFKVLQLLKTNSGSKKLPENDQELLESDMLVAASGSGSDSQLEEAYNEIGLNYFERQKWDIAVKYFIMSRNLEKQAECYFILEDYESLSKVMDQLPDNSELLTVRFKCFKSSFSLKRF